MKTISNTSHPAENNEQAGKAIVQVDDEIAILDHMLMTTKTADELLRPTNYWSSYQKRLLSDLRSNGLHDFRGRKFSLFRSFGAVDIDPHPFVHLALPRGGGLASRIITRTLEMLPGISLRLEGHSSRGLVEYGVWIARRAFAEKGINLTPCQTDRIGNPLDVYEVDGELWSRAQLGDAMTYFDFESRIDIPKDGIVCELGPGMGRTAGIFASYNPEQTIILFDIPPQLYILNQYLKKRFGSRVIPYETAVEIDMSGKRSLPDELRGKIIILPTARMPDWSTLKIDLFWNCASFQEMEPNVVRNYLQMAKAMQPEAVFIAASPGGNYTGPWKPGSGSTKEAVTSELFKECLESDFRLHSEFLTNIIFKAPGCMTYIFERRQAA